MSVLDSDWFNNMGDSSSISNGGLGSGGHGDSEQQTHAVFTPAPAALPKHTSPLLSTTPPAVTKALSQAYPLVLTTDAVFGLLTWTSDDTWKSVLMVLTWCTVVLYYDFIVGYGAHLLAAAAVAGYVHWKRTVDKAQEDSPTLDAIIHCLSNCTARLNLFISPITTLSLSPHDVTRLLFTTLFLSPVYMAVAFFLVTPRIILMLAGLLVLSYHSVYARATRAVLWRSRTVRLVTFYLTGLDFSGSRRASPIQQPAAAVGISGGGVGGVQTENGKPVQFTYVLYENQRRWLGIGWTPNLLAYERAAWTDAFLNESSPPDSFELPEDDGINLGVRWKWLDKTWRLDLTNDGALVLNSKNSKRTTTANPGKADGWLYFDNTWKNPSTEDVFSKYTRRRRWVRTAELTNINAYTGQDDGSGAAATTTAPAAAAAAAAAAASAFVDTTVKKPDASAVAESQKENENDDSDAPQNSTGGLKQRRKSLRFADVTEEEN